jgi:sugar phosphate isomerase/epimerase
MKIGCCAGFQYYDLIARSGYNTIILAGKELASLDKNQFIDVRKKIEEGPLEAIGLNAFCGHEIKLTGLDFDFNLFSEYTKFLLDRAAQLKLHYIGIGAPRSRNIYSGDRRENSLEQLRKTLYSICNLARPYNIDILLESVCSIECNLITTTREALEEIRTLGIDNLHLVYDIYHEYVESQSPEIIKLAYDEIRTVHLAQNGKQGRLYLNEKTKDDYTTYLTALKETGFNAEICVEAFIGEPKEEIPRSAIILKKILAEIFHEKTEIPNP